MEHSEPQPSFWIFSSQTKIALLWVTTHIHAKDSKYQAVDLFYKIYSIHIRNHVQSRTLWLPNIAHFDSNHKKEVHANICSIFNEIKLFHKPLQFTFHFVKLIFNQLLISMFKHSKNYGRVFFHSWVTCNLVFIYKFFKILHFFLFATSQLHICQLRMSHDCQCSMHILNIWSDSLLLFSTDFCFLSRTWNLNICCSVLFVSLNCFPFSDFCT